MYIHVYLETASPLNFPRNQCGFVVLMQILPHRKLHYDSSMSNFKTMHSSNISTEACTPDFTVCRFFLATHVYAYT